MKKKWFDPALFREGLRQLKLSGIVLLIISLILNALSPILAWSEHLNMQKVSDVSKVPFNVSIRSLVPLYIPLFYLIPIILVLILFGAFHKRKGSDFYHSLPHMRGSLFISFGAAALVWFAAITVLSVLLPALLYTAFRATLISSYIPQVLFTYLAGGVLVTAVMLLAMSLTGTVIVNLILAALILLLPRIITTLFSCVISNSLVIVSSHDFNVIGNTAYNIPANFFLYMCGTFIGRTVTNENSLFFTGGALAYTFLLAAVYFVLGWLAFRARKSESAGFSAPSRLLQHVYRCAFTLPVAVFIPFYMLYHTDTNTSNNIVYIILAVLSVIVYFLFELITTKKLKNLLTAAPVLLVLVAVDTALGLGAAGIRNQVLNQSVSANNIQYVTIQLDTPSRQNSTETQFNDLLTADIRYTNTEVRNQVASDLAYAIKTVRHNLNAGGQNLINLQTNYTAVIHTKDGRTFTRYLENDGAEQSQSGSPSNEALAAVMRKNAEFAARSTILPDDSEIKQMNMYSDNGTLSAAQSKKLWSTYREEFNELTDVQRSSLLIRYYADTGPASSLASININGTHGQQYFYSAYAITPMTPKAANAAIAYTNTDNTIEKLKSYLRQNTDNNNNSIYFQFYNVAHTDGASSSIRLSDGKNQDIVDILQKNLGEPVDITGTFVKIFSTGNSAAAYLPLSENDLAVFRQSGLLS